MHILYIHQHFTTNAGSSGTRSYDYARYLVQAGHKVTMLTGVYALGPFGQDLGRGLVHARPIDGIDVVILKVPYANQMSFVRRVGSFLLFAWLSVWVALRQKKVDVVLATSTPLTVGLPALAMRLFRRVPYVFEVRDIWPEFAVSIGTLKNPVAIRIAYWAERLFYRRAKKIQVISEGMRRAMLRRGIAEGKLAVLPTGVDLGLYRDVQPDDRPRRQLGWQGRLIAVYAGALSDANGLEYVVEAAAAAKDDGRIGFLVIGDGRRKQALVESARRQGLANLRFEPSMPKEQLIHVLADCDVGMLILRPLADFAMAMPNKLFDYLAAGLAVMVNFEGDAADELSAGGAGGASDPRAPASLARALQAYAADPGRLFQAKSAAKALAAKFDRAVLAKGLEETLKTAAGSPT